MSKSWSSNSVEIRTIEKPSLLQPRGLAVIITDIKKREFWLWGGFAQETDREGKDPAMYKFTADGKGGGKWTGEAPKNWKSVRNVEQAAYVSTDKATYIIGGMMTFWTEPDQPPIGGEQAVEGMIKFDLETKSFTNDTQAWSPIDSTMLGGQAQFLPGYGKNGVILLMGGMETTLLPAFILRQQQPFDFRNLTFFDPVTNERYWQIATGDIPPATPRTAFCAASHRSSNGGQEILIFGGMNPWGDESVYSDAYILSLPGFFWTKVPDLPNPRRQHTCVSVGKRQVLSVGGTEGGINIWKISEDPKPMLKDPAPQGLMLFDMATLQWKYEYDANDDPYESAESIRNWYKNGSLGSVQWSSNKVRALFTKASEPEPGTGNAPTGEETPPGDKSSSSKTQTGEIVGGVVGGVLGLALIGVCAVVYLKRFQAKKQHIKVQEAFASQHLGFNRNDLLYTQPYHFQPQELPNGYIGSELPGYREQSELPAFSAPVELPSERHRY